MRAIDCQGYGGGFALGAVQAGFELIHKAEDEDGFGVAQCEENRHLLGDFTVETVNPDNWQPVQAEYVFSNPPCSGFSAMTKTVVRGSDSPLNHCMYDTIAYAGRVNPRAVAMESVQTAGKAMKTGGLPLMRELRARLEHVTKTEWHMSHVFHNVLGLGGAAVRKRYFLVLTKEPVKFYPSTLAYCGVQAIPHLTDSIGDLAELELKEAPQHYQQDPTWWSYYKRAEYVTGHILLDKDPSSDRTMSLLRDPELWPPRLEHGSRS